MWKYLPKLTIKKSLTPYDFISSHFSRLTNSQHIGVWWHTDASVKWVTIGSGNGLSLSSLSKTNADYLSIGSPGTTSGKSVKKNHKTHFQILSAKCLPYCSGLNVQACLSPTIMCRSTGTRWKLVHLPCLHNRRWHLQNWWPQSISKLTRINRYLRVTLKMAFMCSWHVIIPSIGWGQLINCKLNLICRIYKIATFQCVILKYVHHICQSSASIL